MESLAIGRPRRGVRRLIVGVVVVLVSAGMAASAGRAGPAVAGRTSFPRPLPLVPVILRGNVGGASALVRALRSVGGRVRRALPVVDGVAADIPADRLDLVGRQPGVRQVTLDRKVSFSSTSPLGYDATADFGSLFDITQIIGAQSSWKAGYTGRGVDVALIDTGVAPVPGLTNGNVVNGPDLSFDSQFPNLTDNDGYGHGTHMASLIAGRDAASPPAQYANPATFTGVAPDARVVSVKVGAFDGSTDASQVIAAIGWVVQHAHDPGINIRVLSLSFGTDSVQDPRVDPLAYAAEVAWTKGIVVVAAAGNDGSSSATLADPAYDPTVIAVGASDPMGTVNPKDDTVPSFVSRGQSRHVDVVAPGVHVLGLRSPGSFVDAEYPSAEVGTRFFRGTGTSQAAAITAGAVALLLQRYPSATPDQVKRALMSTAVSLKSGSTASGSGSIQVWAAEQAPLPASGLTAKPYGSGLGLLEGSRGTYHVSDGGVALQGERDIFAAPWQPAPWAATTAAGTAWHGGTWNGSLWTGSGWTGTSWTATAWANTVWTSPLWSGAPSSASSAIAWTGRSWTSDGWSGGDWTGRSWTADGWSGEAWATFQWQ